jgi:hypothetical protein
MLPGQLGFTRDWTSSCVACLCKREPTCSERNDTGLAVMKSAARAVYIVQIYLAAFLKVTNRHTQFSTNELAEYNKELMQTFLYD